MACPGVGEPPSNLSLSLSKPSPSLSRPIPAPRSRGNLLPRAPQRGAVVLGNRPGSRGGVAENAGAVAPTPPFLSLRQSLGPPSVAGVGGKPGPVCWRCGDPGHFQDRCPVMEVGMMIRVPDSPVAAPDQAGQYQIPVSVKGGTYRALVDSGCNQTSIHQSLVQQGALDMSRKVKVRCVHGDVVGYPLVPVGIQFRRKKHSIRVAVNPHLRRPLILGTDWPAFSQLLGVLCADVSWGTGLGRGEAVAQAGDAVPGPLPSDSEETRVRAEVLPPERDDFPLEQSRDETLKNAYDRVRTIDGQLLQPDQPLSYPYFSIIKDRLYRVTQDAQTKEDTTQLVVPKSRRKCFSRRLTVVPWQAIWGKQKHVNVSWPDSFGRAFMSMSAGGVRHVVNVSWLTRRPFQKRHCVHCH